ncbi:hypothetical protein [Dactylosporangium salmoneum]|uniref:Uncharacterized protein n=1 Tax=Dactylosporangium salmoneum TaxID=53361 RepID=A0ABP5T813_9ACTN
MNYDRYKAILRDANTIFTSDIAGAEMTVLHDDGLYRHIRFKGSGFTWFDLVTWPGNLTVKGSHGTYTFSRETDMFGFFRQSNGVNVDYWAEKTPDGRQSVKVYSEEATTKRLVEVYTEHGRQVDELQARYEVDLSTWKVTPPDQRYPRAWQGVREPVKPKTVAELRREVAEARRDGELSYEDGARRFLADWESVDIVSGVYEWDLREYDFHFVWSCHAIAWGIRQYDAVKAAPVGELVEAVAR